MSIPNPLTPQDCDLREFPFMPLDVVRLRDSNIAAVSSGDEFRCAVLLWCASWHQVPAASLPNDDIVLAHLAGFGRVVKEWKKVREGSLRGWIKCSDGRLYHPVVAEKANEAWKRKLERSWNTECARIKKFNQRHELAGDSAIPFPTLEQFLSIDYVPPKAATVPKMSLGTFAICPEGQQPNVPDLSSGKLCRQGYREDSGQGEYVNNKSVYTTLTEGGAADAVCVCLKSEGILDANPLHPRLIALLEAGLTADEIASIGPEAKQKSKSFAWILATAEGRRRDAANIGALPKKTEKPWFMSSPGIEAKAQELGITKQSNELFPYFKARVYQATGITEEMVRKEKIDAGERV